MQSLGSRMEVRLPVVFFSLLMVHSLASASTPFVSGSGTPVRWGSGKKFNLAGNLRNQSGISSVTLFQAVATALESWSRASNNVLSFDYWQGSDSNIYETNSQYNGLSSLHFASAGGSNPELGVVGVTQIWYRQETGEILEADILLNDVHYVFTDHPTDTSGPGSGKMGYSNRIYLRNVVTHELGHAMGMSHSGVSQSAMLFMEGPQQAHLSCDDRTGVRTHYRSQAGTGVIRGKVTAPSGQALMGAQVVAISARRGVVLSASLTKSDGTFEVGALEPGRYYLMIEPYTAGAATLPPYYQQMETRVCGNGNHFSRTFVRNSTSNHRMREFGITADSTQDAGTILVNCASSGGAAIETTLGNTQGTPSASSPINLSGVKTFGIVDRLGFVGQTLTYGVQSPGGRLRITGMSHTLYSQVRLTLELLDAWGNVLASSIHTSMYAGNSGYKNFDFELEHLNLPAGNYGIRVSSAPLNSSYFTGNGTNLDSVPYFLLVGTFDPEQEEMTSQYPENGRCENPQWVSSYQSPPGNPVRSQTDDASVGFCGSVQKGPSAPGGILMQSTSLPNILGWLFPWFLMAIGARLLAHLEQTR